jgi:hypothetical protein
MTKKKSNEKMAQGLGTNPTYPQIPKPILQPEEPEDRAWTFSIGIYPGILFGVRTYEEADFKTHVLYLPFIDFALEIDN